MALDISIYEKLQNETKAKILEQLVTWTSPPVAKLFDVRAYNFAPDFFDEDATPGSAMRYSVPPGIFIFLKTEGADSYQLSQAEQAKEKFLKKGKANGLVRDGSALQAEQPAILVQGINSIFSRSIKPIELPKVLQAKGRTNA